MGVGHLAGLKGKTMKLYWIETCIVLFFLSIFGLGMWAISESRYARREFERRIDFACMQSEVAQASLGIDIRGKCLEMWEPNLSYRKYRQDLIDLEIP